MGWGAEESRYRQSILMFLRKESWFLVYGLQPLDQGFIRSFKVEYTKELDRKLINAIEDGEKLPSITVLDAMRMIDYAWRCVTEKIKNCFKKAGFEKSCTVVEQQLKETEEQPDEETNENAKEWMSIRDELNIDTVLHLKIL